MFDAITPPASEVIPILDQMEGLQMQILNGYKGLIAQRNELRSQLERMLSRQCEAVNALAGGDLTILDASGFDRYKQRTPSSIPAQVANVSVSNGTTSGDVELKFHGVSGRSYYTVQVRQSGGEWSTVMTTTNCRHIIPNLPVKEYSYFRVSATNPAGQGNWSAPVRLVVGR